MKILVVGINKENFNYKKIEGFNNSFSKIGKVEHVTNFFDASEKFYDIVFSEMKLSEIFLNIEKYKTFNIKTHIIWCSYSIDKLIELSKIKPETFFIGAYKSNVFDRKISESYIEKYKTNFYQMSGEEGLNLFDFLNLKSNLINENLFLTYLPCCLSEKKADFIIEKKYDICYFGTLNNRPKLKKIINELNNFYSLKTNAWDSQGIISPEECYELYRISKITISEQVNPVELELPVRLGESSSVGCKFFLLSEIELQDLNNELIPNFYSSKNSEELICEIRNYLDNFNYNKSKSIYDNFVSTYDNATNNLLNIIKNYKLN